MMNFCFGTVAGGIIACVITIVAARQPDVQSRLGLIPSAQAALAVNPIAHVEPKCPSKAEDSKLANVDKLADKLFEKRRFWFVAP